MHRLPNDYIPQTLSFQRQIQNNPQRVTPTWPQFLMKQHHLRTIFHLNIRVILSTLNTTQFSSYVTYLRFDLPNHLGRIIPHNNNPGPYLCYSFVQLSTQLLNGSRRMRQSQCIGQCSNIVRGQVLKIYAFLTVEPNKANLKANDVLKAPKTKSYLQSST